jgi:hypothetical protein
MITPGTEIDASRARYPTSVQGIRGAGLVDTPGERSPPLVWIDGLLTNSEAESLRQFQRVNKIPCMDFLCYKSTLFGELNAIRRVFPTHFDFYPHTYLLPSELLELQREHSFICGRTATAPTWVVKPRNGCCGKGIHFLQSIPDIESVNYQSVAQLMVNPLLLDGKKFDFRFFLLISSLDPLSVFIYKEGIARFCTQPYIVPTKTNLDRPFSHLTNTAINKTGTADPNDFTKPATVVLKEVAAKYPSATRVWEEICQASLFTIVGLYPAILTLLPLSGGSKVRSRLIQSAGPKIVLPKRTGNITLSSAFDFPFLGANPKRFSRRKKRGKGKRGKTKKGSVLKTGDLNFERRLEEEKSEKCIEPEKEEYVNPKSRVLTEAQHYFHILGIDIILDSKGHPKVLELNDRPSLQVTATFEHELKEGMIREAFKHLSLDGSSFGNCEESQWRQILPVPSASDLWEPVQAMMQFKSDLKYQQRTAVDSPSSQRMMAAGVKQNVHEMYRMRFFKDGITQNNCEFGADERSALPPLENGKYLGVKSDDLM